MIRLLTFPLIIYAFSLAGDFATAAPAVKNVNVGSDDKLHAYQQELHQIQADVRNEKSDGAKTALVEKAYQKFLKLSNSQAEDYLARSLAGLFAAQRCQFTTNVTKLSDYVGEAIPLLDKSARDARKSSSGLALWQVLRNRAEVYSTLPDFFHKEKIALEDSVKLMDLTAKEKLPPIEAIRIKLIYARALAKNHKSAEGEVQFKAAKDEAAKGHIDVESELKSTRRTLDESK